MRTRALRLLCVLSFVVLSFRTLLADEQGNRARATLRRMESVATAIQAYMTDRNEVPRAASFESLVPALTPTYIRELQLRDGWETPFRYVRTGQQSFQIASAGSDRTFDEKSWSTAAQTEDLAADAVYVTNAFHRTWMQFGAPLHRSEKEWQEAARPMVEAEIEKMKGMSALQSFSYLRTSSTLRDLGVLGLFLKAYKMKYGRYPSAKSMAELEAMFFPEFASEVTTRDKWGTELRYVVAKDGQAYRLISAGADGTFDEASWTRKGKLALDDDDAVLESGELVREWTTETQPGLGPRAMLEPKARGLLAQADARVEAGDHGGALDAYMQAVKADRKAADLESIHRYAPLPFDVKPQPQPPPSAQVTASHIAALRQFLEIHPGNQEAESDLVMLLPTPEAVAFVSEILKRRPRDPEISELRSQLRFRASQYMDGIADLEQASKLDAENAERFYVLGVSAYEVVAKYSGGSTEQQKRDLIRRGFAAFDRAEALRPDYFEALTYRNLLLREQAKLETDPAVQQKLIEEADAVRRRAIEILQTRRRKPPVAEPGAPLRIGGDVKAPIIRHRVEPVIPEAARAAGVSGIVILETVIDKEGRVRNATVLKGLPHGLDDAAVEAVKQWTFAPGTLNGVPIDVIFHLTVNMKSK